MSTFQVHGDDGSTPRWWAELCRLSAYAEDERRWADMGGRVLVRIFDKRQYAVDHYVEEVNRSPGFDGEPDSQQRLDGWWDEGSRLAGVEERQSLEDMLVIGYYLQHDNLYLQAQLFTKLLPEDMDRGVELVDELMEALVEEAIAHVPLAQD